MMGFYGIRVVECIKNFSSLRCQAGFNERTATTGLKKCLSILTAVGNIGQCIKV